MLIRKNFKKKLKTKIHKIYPCRKFEDLKRNIYFAKQVKKDGFSDRETWSLDISFAKWLLPKVSEIYPIITKNDIKINEIVWFLKLVAEEDAIFPIAEEYRKRAYKASELLGKNFFKLLSDQDDAKKLGIEAAKWLYPRFKRLEEIKLTKVLLEQETIKDYRNIRWFLWKTSSQSLDSFNKEQKKRLKQAQKLFGEYFLTLWW